MKKQLMIILSLCLGLTMAGCRGASDDPIDDGGTVTGEVLLRATTKIIRADGVDATVFSVLVTDSQGVMHDVTSEAEIYYEGNDTPLAEPQFASSEEGTYVFYAVHGFSTSTNDITVRVANGIGELPEDAEPNNTDFRHRIMLLQHTGTGCYACPMMMTTLDNLSKDEAYSGLYNHVASHSYSTKEEGDKAYSTDARQLSLELNPGRTYPTLGFNLALEFADELNAIKAKIDLLSQNVADVGIRTNVTLNNGVIYVNTGVKARVSGQYRVAVWALEDSIYSAQTNASSQWQNTHNNCVRKTVGDSKNECIYGATIGALKAGDSAEYVAAIDVESDWVTDNMEVIVIVTADNGQGVFDLVNCVVCPVGESLNYEYNQ
ncbi:MAG: Omp28-related outer membrane protein [Tidjanibacter sp.]|nr:Omp28-related outer membrane protein [Tidjanibacter sp.]